jgi:hypothetical protein
MSRFKDRGKHVKKRPGEQKKTERRRAQDAEYDCRLNAEPERLRVPLRGFAARVLGPSHWVDEDEVE